MKSFPLSGSELQSEVENLALRIYYLENAKEDVRSDIAVMRRAAEKADTEVAKAESEKHRQVYGVHSFNDGMLWLNASWILFNPDEF